MDHFSFLYESREKDILIIRIPRSHYPSVRAISWAMRGGGFSAPSVVVNHSTDDLWIDDIDCYVNDFTGARGILPGSIVMVTAVSQRFQGMAEVQGEDPSVRAYATVGLGNALAAGDPASAWEVGTINLIVIVDAALSDEALIESVAIIAEAKAGYLFSQGVKSVATGRPATGTGTDCTAIVSLGIGVPLRYAGKHTILGERIARAVSLAMEDSLRRRTLLGNDANHTLAHIF